MRLTNRTWEADIVCSRARAPRTHARRAWIELTLWSPVGSAHQRLDSMLAAGTKISAPGLAAPSPVLPVVGLMKIVLDVGRSDGRTAFHLLVMIVDVIVFLLGLRCPLAAGVSLASCGSAGGLVLQRSKRSIYPTIGTISVKQPGSPPLWSLVMFALSFA